MDVDVETLETLNLLTRDGAQAANESLMEMVDQRTAITVTRVTVADGDDITAEIRRDEKVGVSFGVDGRFSGTLLFTFDESAVDRVTELLVGPDASESMTRSSVTELGNIMMGGFLAGWGDALGTGLDATPPTHLDAGELATFEVGALGPETDSALAFQTAVEWRDTEVGIDIYLLPDRTAIENVVEADMDAGEADDTGAFGMGGTDNSDDTATFDQLLEAERDDGDDDTGDSDANTVEPTANEETATADGTVTADSQSGSDDGDSPFGGADSPFGSADDGKGPFGGGEGEESPFGSGDGGDGPLDGAIDGDGDTVGFDGLGGGDGPTSLSLDKLSVFSDLTREGTEAAAERVTTMTGIETQTELAGINFTPIEDIPTLLGDGSFVGTRGEFEGTPAGHLVLVFDEASARTAAEAMAPVESDDEDGLTAMHRSAIEELGNIVTSGFIDGWANVLEGSVEHTPPAFVDDMELTFMEVVGEQLGAFQTHGFSIESAMQATDADFACRLFALPSESALAGALESLAMDRREQTQADPSDFF